MTKRATSSQAKRLAGLFCGQYGGVIHASRRENYVTPTDRAIIARGWVSANGKIGAFPSGAPYDEYEINDAGLEAPEEYLRHARLKREAAA
ncbi:hypothetical protein [Methylocystis sp. SC2]|uniref:hypothetical protein n=1 Tax=Methylocystis sp. (strain SC2) TaxID=187303 RepID=UPI00027AEF33|nr:hypothetical protein [Methylocystis sp. SC2]CCJ07033.1 Hypothetical protein BN69_1582 [Methylocystis sp. SC2]